MSEISNVQSQGPAFQPSSIESSKEEARIKGEETSGTETVESTSEDLVASLVEDPPPQEDNFRSILRLLMEIGPIIQRTSAAIAEQSRVLPTAMIAFYTDRIASIKLVDESTPGFTKEDIPDDTKRVRLIGERNDKLMNDQEKLRSQRDYWQTIAKQTQTVLNQSMEAANQNTDLLNAFFQQLRELTSALTRS